MIQSYQNLISISTILNPNKILILDNKMVQYDTEKHLFYVLNIFINIKLFFISLFNLYRICMYSMVILRSIYTHFKVSESCDLCERTIRISLCQVSGSQMLRKLHNFSHKNIYTIVSLIIISTRMSGNLD